MSTLRVKLFYNFDYFVQATLSEDVRDYAADVSVDGFACSEVR